MFGPEDNSSDCDVEDQPDDSICRGRGISVATDTRNIKFEIFSTRIHKIQRKSCVVSPFFSYNVSTVLVLSRQVMRRIINPFIPKSAKFKTEENILNLIL